MTQANWNKIKDSKMFYISSYRLSTKLLLASLLLNCLLILGVFYSYLSLPEPDYYATNGITPPEKLSALLAPNESSEPLLPEETSTENENKPIPS